MASLGSTTTAPAAPAAQGLGLAQRAVAFTRCVRSHGVANLPMPVVNAPGHVGIDISAQVVGSPHFQSAEAHCRDLLPKGGGETPAISPADQADYLTGVACMRSHGFSSFPDPTISGNQVRFDVPPGIDQRSARFEQAVEVCERLIPAGLPYSDNGGS